MRTTNVFAGVLIVLMCLAVLIPASSSGEAREIVVKGVSDTGVDLNNDNILDRLAITMQVHVKVAGTYTVYGIIKTIDTDPIATSNATDLQEGNGQMVLEFTGETLYESGMDGPYVVDLRITGGEAMVPYSYTTGQYVVKDFDQESESPSPMITMGNENLTLEFPSVMHVPKITFYPTLKRQDYHFEVSFESLLGFSDDGDGVYTDADEVLVHGDLRQSIWDESIYQEGGVLRLTFENTIDLWDVKASNPVGMCSVKFIFNTNVEGTYKKFDIDYRFSGTFPGVDYFTLEHTLEDLSGKTRFNVGSVNGEPRIQFINGGDEMMAYYQWVDVAASYGDKGEETIALNYSTETERGVMTLYVCYPYEEGSERILHDPILGIKEWFVSGVKEDPDGADHSIISFLGSLVLGGLFIGYTIHSRRKRG